MIFGSDESSDYVFKIILIGDVGVGKTSLINTFLHSKFIDEHRITAGVEVSTKYLTLDDQTKIRLEIWDTCGEERFQGIVRNFYRDAAGCLLVYDITNPKSFENLKHFWLAEVENYAPRNILKMVVGNKSDLKDQRKIKQGDVASFASSQDLGYSEVNVKQPMNIDFAFKILANEIKRCIKSSTNFMRDRSGTFQVDAKIKRKIEKKGKCCC